ncbi:hypothetical protein QP384_15535 [Klebsiella pneumoniae]|uniref:hypothetical protein n=1 Tax=Klebsiella pneumoniae TaxID=573 RepID=UPI002555A58E|nr:hypothetical protein [Klebsiella pneumoniae]MDK6952125.1 hypothetical protein [Klebsiella pneumoniae]
MFKLTKVFVPGAIVVDDLLAIIYSQTNSPVAKLLPADGCNCLLAATSDVVYKAAEDHLHAVPGFAQYTKAIR